MLKERGVYVLRFANGDQVTFKFNTYCWLKFCEISGGITYAQMLDLFNSGLSLRTIIDLLKSASGLQVSDEDAASWIDEMGGITGAKFLEVINTAAESLIDKGAKDDGKKKAVRS